MFFSEETRREAQTMFRGWYHKGYDEGRAGRPYSGKTYIGLMGHHDGATGKARGFPIEAYPPRNLDLGRPVPTIRAPYMEVLAAFRQSRNQAERDGFPTKVSEVQGYIDELEVMQRDAKDRGEYISHLIIKPSMFLG